MKIWLNAVRLPKFERVIVVAEKDHGKRFRATYVPGWRDFAHAQRAAWSLTQGYTLICQITPF